MMASKNSFAVMMRVPRVLRTTISASSAAATRHHSDAGSACAIAAAERAARADGLVRDVPHDVREQFTERALRCRLLERRVPHGRADAKLPAFDGEPRQLRHAIDVDEVFRPRQAERHGGHEALPAGQHAPVVGRDSASVATASSIVFGA